MIIIRLSLALVGVIFSVTSVNADNYFSHCYNQKTFAENVF